MLKSAEFSPTALATSSRPTISTANDWRVGMSIEFEKPRIIAMIRMCQTWIRPVTLRPNRMNARVIATDWVTIRVRRFGS